MADNDDWSGLVSDYRQMQADRLRGTMLHGSTVTPEQQGQVLDLSAKLNRPPAAIQQDIPAAQKEAAVDTGALQELITTSPKSKAYFDNPDFANLSSDDLPELATFERTWRTAIGEVTNVLGTSIGGIGVYSEHAYEQTLGKVFGNVGADIGKFLYDLMPIEGAADLPTMHENPGADVLQQIGAFYNEKGAIIDIPPDQSDLYTDSVRAISQMGAQIGTTLINPIAGTMGFLGYGYKTKYDEAIKKGADEQTAQIAGMASAVVEGLTEKAGVDKAIAAIPKEVRNSVARTAGDLLLTGANEVGQEWLANVGQNLIDRVILDEDKDLIELPGKEELLAGGAATFWRAVIHGATRGRMLKTEEENAEANRQAFEDLRAATVNSKTFQRNKDAFTAYAQSVLEDSPSANVGINARGLREYLQSLPDGQAGEVVDALGIERSTYREAIEFSQDLQVPLARLLSLSDTDHYNNITPDTRLRSGDLTLRETQTVMQSETQLEEQSRTILDEQQGNDEFQASADRVFAAVQEELTATNRFTPDVLARYSALHRANAVVLADELGITPEEVYSKFGLRVRSPLTEKPEPKTKPLDAEAVDEFDAPVPIANRLTDDSRGWLESFKSETGWAEEGGRVMMDDDGKVLGRTQWLPNADWWPGRPGALSPAATEAAIDKALAGEDLSTPEYRMIQYLLDIAEDAQGGDPFDMGGDGQGGDPFGLNDDDGDGINYDQSAQGLGAVVQAAKERGVDMAASERDNIITLSKIKAHEAGTGVGTQAMQALIDYADATGQAVALSPSSDFGGNKKRLRELYKRFGFVDNKGKNKAFTISETMIRLPVDGDLVLYQDDKVIANLTGDELGDFGDDIDGLKKAAFDYYSTELQHGIGSVTHPKIGEITFSGKGKKELRRASDNPGKLRLFPAIPEILTKGHYHGREDLYKARKDGTVAFHYFTGLVDIGGEIVKAGITVTEDEYGNKFYNLNPDPDALWEKKKARILPPAESEGSGPFAEDDSTLNQSIAEDAGGVNIAVLDQPGDDPRANIEFPDGFPGDPATINLFEGADLSSFLHETGHFFLQSRIELAKAGDLTPRMQADMDTLLDWFGVDSVDQIEVAQHEQFARGFEAYLREGKAPTPGLDAMFARFRVWLIQVYKNLAQLNVELSDPVRQVFDRMVATQDAIDEAQAYAGDRLLFTDAAAASMTEPEFESYVETREKARDLAQRDLEKRVLDEMRRANNKEFKAARARIKSDEEDRLEAVRAQQLRANLTKGTTPKGQALPNGIPAFKFSKEGLRLLYGEDYEKVRRRVQSMIAKTGGQTPDQIAEFYGYGSGDEMIRELVETKNFKDAVREAVNSRVTAELGDLYKDPAQMAEAAIDSVYGDERANFVATELRALEKRAGLPLTPRQVLQSAARRRVADTEVGRLSGEGVQIQIMMRETRKAEAAFGAGEYAAAAEAKRAQLMAYYSYQALRDASDDARKIRKYLDKFSSPGVRGKLDRDYLDQIDNILEAVDLRPISGREAAKRQAFSEWAEAQEQAGNEVVVPPRYVESLGKRNYRTLSYEEVQGLRDAVKNVEHLGRLKHQLQTNKEKRDFDEAIEAAVERAKDTNDWKPGDISPPATWWEKAKEGARLFAAEHLKVEFLTDQLDGGTTGPWWDLIFRPMADAEAAEQNLMDETVSKLRDIFDKIPKKERNRWKSKRVYVKPLHRNMTKGELISLALNWGNEENRLAVIRGESDYQWNEQMVEQAITQHLTDADLDMVESVWTLIDGFWPQISDLQKRLTGVVPPKVEASEFTLASGRTLKGGYYPLRYDPGRNQRAFEREQKTSVQELYGQNFLRPATRKGHTKERVGSAGQAVLYSVDVISEHITNVIHDITHREAILAVDKVVQDKRIREAVTATAGQEVYRELRPWLAAVASSKRPLETQMESWLSKARRNATVVNMGWKLTTAIVQPLGYLQSVDFLGKRWAAKGLAKFYGNPAGIKSKVEYVFGMSAMMRHRAQSFDRDVNDAMRSIQGDSAYKAVQRTFFSHIGFFDLAVSMPTWLGGFDKAKAEGLSDDDAVAQADRAVRMSQSAGTAMNLAGIQQGSEFKRLFTMFYSYFNVLYNLLRRAGKRTIRGGWTPENLARAMQSYLFLVVLPAALAEVIVGRWPDEEDDDEENAWKMARTVGFYPLASVVGIRDISNAMVTDFDAELSPVFGVPNDILQGLWSGVELATGEGDETDIKRMTMATGYLFGLPARQLWISASNAHDILDGEDLNWAEWAQLKEHRD